MKFWKYMFYDVFTIISNYSHVYFNISGLRLFICMVIYLCVYLIECFIKHNNRCYSTICAMVVTCTCLTTLVSRRLFSYPMRMDDAFITYKNLIDSKDEVEFVRIIHNIMMNILLFIPVGVITKWNAPAGRTMKYVILFSLTIEILQALLGVGVFELCDIIHNTIGGLIGCLLVKIILMVFKKKRAYN